MGGSLEMMRPNRSYFKSSKLNPKDIHAGPRPWFQRSESAYTQPSLGGSISHEMRGDTEPNFIFI